MTPDSMCTCGHKLKDHVFSGPDEDGNYEPEGCMGLECHCPYPEIEKESQTR